MNTRDDVAQAFSRPFSQAMPIGSRLVKRGLLTVIKLAQWAAGKRGDAALLQLCKLFLSKNCKRERERLTQKGRGRGRFITGGDDRKAQARIKHAGCEPLVTSAPSSIPISPLYYRSRAARQQSTHSTAFNVGCVSGQLGVVAYTLTWLLFFPPTLFLLH